ncbi:MAG TPA: TolC family protein, partial [Polyangiaceae bacterium]|nr:TolC family protein [Polyangiaceae bacterium]
NYASEERFSANGKHVTWTIGGVLTWPLYDGGLRYGTRQSSAAQARLAQEDVTDARRAARVESAQAKRAVNFAKQNLAVSQRSREIARQSSRLSQIAFTAGQGSSFELVDASRRLREAEIDSAIKEFELVRAQIAALLALSSCDV